MYIFIPLGGLGERFKQVGYDRPKALIPVLGKPILFWLIDSLLTNTIEVEQILIAYHREYYKYRLEDLLRERYPHLPLVFHCLDLHPTKGALETLSKGLCLLTKDAPLLCLDGDNFYKINVLEKWKRGNEIFVFHETTYPMNHSSPYSYCLLDVETKVQTMVEKTKISDWACTGAYGFASMRTVKEFLSKYEWTTTSTDEIYLSSGIRSMIHEHGHVFHTNVVDQKDWICLGTPLQTRSFMTSSSDIPTLRICFDLDNTLVTFPSVKGDYSTVRPIMETIEWVRHLKQQGHVIIIYTARRMKSHGGNLGKIAKDIGRLTFETLDNFDIPYDELYFGKPHADFYVDDLAVNASDSFSKKMGFLKKQNIQPRTFHELTLVSPSVIQKKAKFGKSLEGEIFFYRHFSSSTTTKKWLPNFYDYDREHYTWYTMEYLDGVSLTSLFLEELLTPALFKTILQSVHEFHQSFSSSPMPDDLPIRENYLDKLRKRYESFRGYQHYRESEKHFQNIYEKLQDYIESGFPRMGVIHGDCVFTNIIVANHDPSSIQFIDMRGKIGDSLLTIYGDVFYDWAKILQSLSGYDEILMDHRHGVSPSYRKQLLNTFWDFLSQYYSTDVFIYIVWITKSHLFSLIPLHDNEKCQQYYDLSTALQK